MTTIQIEAVSEIALPYEIRRLIFKNVDETSNLETVKSLRLVSKSWALTGFEFLLRDTFVIKSNSDVDRLSNVTSDPKWIVQSRKQINAIQIQSSHSSFSSIRHRILERTSPSNFPEGPKYSQRDERRMLNELEEADNKRDSTHLNGLNHLDVLVKAFCQLPRLHTVDFAVPNPFKDPELRKLWRETSLGDYQTQPDDIWTSQLINILSALREAKIQLETFTYTQLPSSLFAPFTEQTCNEMWSHLSSVKSLALTINDGHNKSGSRSILQQGRADSVLARLASTLPHLESLFIHFTLAQNVPITLWPTAMEGKLHSICLIEISLLSEGFLAFLDLHKSTLRRLSLGSVNIRDPRLTFRSFVECLKAHFQDFMLEKFELCGAIYSSVPRDDAWFTSSIYTKDWKDVVLYEGINSNVKTKMLEEFVLRGRPWPMTDEDDISYLTRF